MEDDIHRHHVEGLGLLELLGSELSEGDALAQAAGRRQVPSDPYD